MTDLDNDVPERPDSGAVTVTCATCLATAADIRLLKHVAECASQGRWVTFTMSATCSSPVTMKVG